MQGNSSLALVSFERALVLAQPEGYVRLFVDEGEPVRLCMVDLRARLEKQTSSPGNPLLVYLEKLLSAFQGAAEQQSTTKPQIPGLIEPLSERELEVLRLVAQGLTNNEISQRLVLALSTVKGHNLRIFGKLQAQNCSEAVRRARELGLL